MVELDAWETPSVWHCARAYLEERCGMETASNTTTDHSLVTGSRKLRVLSTPRRRPGTSTSASRGADENLCVLTVFILLLPSALVRGLCRDVALPAESRRRASARTARDAWTTSDESVATGRDVYQRPHGSIAGTTPAYDGSNMSASYECQLRDETKARVLGVGRS